mmetsp:Transcript_2456/g.6103  ORF Transcript_2456/g.6103 Transcript_2456/m.6103 type:complete len:219 (-) Transcript_2456:190-846(-)
MMRVGFEAFVPYRIDPAILAPPLRKSHGRIMIGHARYVLHSNEQVVCLFRERHYRHRPPFVRFDGALIRHGRVCVGFDFVCFDLNGGHQTPLLVDEGIHESGVAVNVGQSTLIVLRNGIRLHLFQQFFGFSNISRFCKGYDFLIQCHGFIIDIDSIARGTESAARPIHPAPITISIHKKQIAEESCTIGIAASIRHATRSCELAIMQQRQSAGAGRIC